MRKPVMKIDLQMHMVFPSTLKKKDIFKHEWPLLAVVSIGGCPLLGDKLPLFLDKLAQPIGPDPAYCVEKLGFGS